MAVQAHHHHPSSTLFFLNRNGQEGNDSSSQPHKSQFYSTNAGVESRKRAREVSSVIDLELAATATMNPPPQVIGPGQNPNLVSTGLRLSREQSHSQEQWFSSHPIIAGDLTGEMKRQTNELDTFLQSQGEELRRMLVKNSARHYHELVRTTEESVKRRLREKEAEIERAVRRHAELEARAAQIESEARAWQARAAAREAEAKSLQAQLQQAVARAANRATAAEPISRSGDGVEDAESAYDDPDRIEMIGPGSNGCRICRQRASTVLSLPCRHLVLCKGCDSSVRVCPLCLTLKNSSVEVIFS